MKKVLVIGEFYSSNLGDGIICDVVTELLNKKYQVVSFDLSLKNNFDYVERNNQFSKKEFYILRFKKFFNYFLFDFFRKCKKNDISKFKNEFINVFNKNLPDMIVFAGGQMFHEYFIEKIKFIVKYCDEKNIPVLFNACGLKYSKNNKFLNDINETLSHDNIRYLSVRDGFEIFKKFNNDVIDTYDTAILCNQYFKACRKTRILGIGVMLSYEHSLKKQISFWSNVISYLEKNNIKWEMFSNGAQNDHVFIKYLLKINGIEEKGHLAKRPTNPKELVGVITKYKSIISMRLHSLIIAYSYDIPSVSICWDKKVRTFFNKINRIDYCFDFNNFDFNVINDNICGYDMNKKNTIVSSINENINTILNFLN